ncbi:MAG: rRNA maturation RNase YbeY [Syntrophobacteraceae bacterium]|nr:rRNA maturation RNase YbeY [Syntrophobacteraceae bacterium]
MARIQVESQSTIKIKRGPIKSAASRVLSALGYTKSELSILIVDDAGMAELNLRYRGIDHATDVLSFPMLEGEFGGVASEMLGDVVISAQTARQMSEESGTSLESILDLLLIHGILHLLGLNHEEGLQEARKVKLKTEELLAMLGHGGKEFEWFFEEETCQD